jgi:serine/threonine protein kinase/tetratricopeptide (TPR) repeat protein
MPIGPGTRLGPYEILSRLGAGGMGEVFRARHTRLQRKVAIKVLPEHLTHDARALERFEREAQAVAALSHPNILAIHDFGVEGAVSFAVMELLEGETLRQWIAVARPSWRRAVEVAVAIAEGLAAAHARGIVHRDVKPENVFLTADGHVKILDFGLARQMESPSTAPSSVETTWARTQPGTLLGTLGYMSPEQARGETAGPPSDIFSLGCVLHELLTGKMTFARASAAETMAAILGESPPPPSASDPSIPPALDTLVRHCLEKAPGRRFHSAQDLAIALRAILSGADPAEPRTSPPPDARDEARGPRRSALAASLTTLGVVVLSAAGSWLWISRGGTRAEPGAAATPSVAVLPFESLAGADDEGAYLGEGVAEAVTTDLSRIAGLTVISRGTAFRYRGRNADLKKAGAELNVRYFVQGTLQRSGERLRLHAHLVDASTGQQLWAERYDRDLGNVFAVQDDIARSVVRAIEPRLVPRAQAAARRTPPAFQAYDAYLRGRAAWSRRTPQGIAQAVALFEQAIEREPGFAEAYAGLSDAFLAQGRFRYERYAEALPRASAAADRALALDPDLAAAHASRGALHLERLEWADAERRYRRAIELEPGYATAHHWYALLLYQLGRLDEGLLEATRATELDPLSVSTQGALGIGLYLRREFDLAAARCQRAAGLSPDYPGPVRQLSLIEAARGRLPAALELARRAARMGNMPVPRANLARMHARLGQSAEARAILSGLEQEAEPCVACVVDVHLALGYLDRALGWVARGGWTPAAGAYYPKTDPAYDAFRQDPRFLELLRLIGLE